MSRVIAVLACGFTVAACSASMPSLNFLSSSPPTESLRFESDPPGAEVKTSVGQTCRTPCELTVQVAPELSATFALNGYQPQTVSVRSEAGSGSARLAPNPVYAELRAAPVAPPAKKRVRKKPPAGEAARANSPVASAAPPAPPSMSAAAPAASPTSEAAASATNYPWPDPPAANSGK
jgi:hypothetical protein